MLWIDISDIRDHARHSRSVTGIQRASLNIIEKLLEREADARLVVFDAELQAYREISLDELWWIPLSARLRSIGLISILARPLPRSWIVQVRDFINQLSPTSKRFNKGICRFEPGDRFLFLGAFWYRPDHVDRLIDVTFSNRLDLFVLVYDIIPLTHHRWYPPGFVSAWQDQLERLLRVTKGIFVISKETASQLSLYIEKAGIKSAPINVLRLGDPVFMEASSAKADIELATKREFVLMVSSIDVRKNQMSLALVWSRLLREYGDAIPDLVLVGKDATGNAQIHAFVDSNDALTRRVKFVQNADDATLRRYYEECLFTVFPSFAEGWGFPVAESLMFGKPCIASRTTSIPEVGGTLCTYIDPHDLDDIYQAVVSLIFDKRRRDEEGGRIAEEFKATTWESTAESILREVQAPRVSAAPAAPALAL